MGGLNPASDPVLGSLAVLCDLTGDLLHTADAVALNSRSPLPARAPETRWVYHRRHQGGLGRRRSALCAPLVAAHRCRIGELRRGALVDVVPTAGVEKVECFEVVADAYEPDGVTPAQPVEGEIGAHLDHHVRTNPGVGRPR